MKNPRPFPSSILGPATQKRESEIVVQKKSLQPPNGDPSSFTSPLSRATGSPRNHGWEWRWGQAGGGLLARGPVTLAVEGVQGWWTWGAEPLSSACSGECGACGCLTLLWGGQWCLVAPVVRGMGTAFLPLLLSCHEAVSVSGGVGASAPSWVPIHNELLLPIVLLPPQCPSWGATVSPMSCSSLQDPVAFP